MVYNISWKLEVIEYKKNLRDQSVIYRLSGRRQFKMQITGYVYVSMGNTI